ncbi:hypothetical protein B9T31_10600 [Acinetobacter sp. ANC 4558]|uniref:dihydrofolate reductase family protein n=1 Tax=Acinetobacter sp. ANC 4558 TaxID=1977876 RepID=UPI000A33C79E|nr:dihydrofolate reductase family protein [Acinetobacter sp. ANC 4558]OTG85608.1 hypothetical protein B9T31_10600 [Acinetobacter sp. ANC 4558]
MSVKIKGYIATSADGYIATQDGSVDFLTPFQHIDCGYDDFIADIDMVVMGRKTYETICSFGEKWPYPNQKGIIITSQENLPLIDSSLSIWTQGVEALVTHLNQNYDANVWLVGGAQLQQSFIDAHLLDSLENYVMPVLLGSGIPLFPQRAANEYPLKSMHAEMIENTVMKITYQFK